MTYTVATMEISQHAYDEIKQRLLSAGYTHAIDSDGMLDMTHIGLLRTTPDFKHIKRGTSYALVGMATVQSSENGTLSDGEEAIVYRGDEDGKLWVRPPGELYDAARFTKL